MNNIYIYNNNILSYDKIYIRSIKREILNDNDNINIYINIDKSSYYDKYALYQLRQCLSYIHDNITLKHTFNILENVIVPKKEMYVSSLKYSIFKKEIKEYGYELPYSKQKFNSESPQNNGTIKLKKKNNDIVYVDIKRTPTFYVSKKTNYNLFSLSPAI